MTEILTDIIFSLIPSTTFSIIQVFIACITVIILGVTLFFVIKYTKAAERQTNELVLQREEAQNQTNELIKQREAAEAQTEELLKQRRLSNLPSLSMDIDFSLLEYSKSSTAKYRPYRTSTPMASPT